MRHIHLSTLVLAAASLWVTSWSAPAVAQDDDTCACLTGDPLPLVDGMAGRTSTNTPRFLVEGDLDDVTGFALVQITGEDGAELVHPHTLEFVEEDEGYGRDILRLAPQSPLPENARFELRTPSGTVEYNTVGGVVRTDPPTPTIEWKSASATCCGGIGGLLDINVGEGGEDVLAFRVEVLQGSASTVLYSIQGDNLIIGTTLRGDNEDEASCVDTAALPSGTDVAVELLVTAIDIYGNESAPAYTSGQALTSASLQCQNCHHEGVSSTSVPWLVLLFSTTLAAFALRRRQHPLS